MKYTVDDVQNTALNNLSGYDKNIGTWIWDITRGVAILWTKLWDAITDARSDYDPDALSGEALEAYVKSWKNISRNPANYATGYVTITGSGKVAKGTRVRNTSADIYYTINDDVTIEGSGKAAITCLSAGEVGNCEAGAIDRIILSNSGIISCTNNDAIVTGYEAESDDELRQRYYDSMLPYGSGNKQHYKMWAQEVDGVGQVQVERALNGAGTVELTIIKVDGTNADDELVSKVQECIDPLSYQGQGVGKAPLGAVVTVSKASEVDITISADIEIKAEYDNNIVINNIKNNIAKHIASINFIGNMRELSYGRVYKIILDTAGVVDCEHLQLDNGSSGDKTINQYCQGNEIFNITYALTEV